MTDTNEDFFKNATMIICGSLDIQTALWRLLLYLRTKLPVDLITLHLNERNLVAIKIFARVDANGPQKVDDVISVPESDRHSFFNLEKQEYVIINDSSKSSVGKLVDEYYFEPPCSAILLPLIIEERYLGVVTIRAFGKDRYTKAQADQIAQLKGPFGIALSNTLKHQEIIEMKEDLADENQNLRMRLRQLSEHQMVGSSSAWKDVLKMIQLIAPQNSPVLITGETGVGKELVADAIHASSRRKDAPFIKVNCGALTEGLLDSTLFGHEKGAFTGATNLRRGVFERAQGGTIFLDEIGEMPMSAQVRLLRIIQNAELERLGGMSTISIDTRIIAAGQKNLEELVALHRFRSDLWFRLNVFPIVIPPIRERKDDIPALVKFFIDRKSRELNLKRTPKLRTEELQLLMDYHWPGNIRELENVVERAVIFSMGKPLQFAPLFSSGKSVNATLPETSGNSITRLDVLIADHINKALAATDGKIHGPGGAAEMLGLNGNTLRSRMKKLGIPFQRKG